MRDEIADEILKASRRRVSKHLSDEDFRDANLALKSTTEHIAREYHGRVVLELIQNAHDALPRERTDGRILIRLDPHCGEHGTLHVANSGHPFTRSNFEAIRKVALSDKPPDEAIGNKGIGFKSVLEVTDSPVVHSVKAVGSSEFDGYCFKFPSIDDISVLVDGSASQQQIAAEMLLLGLPIPAGPAGDDIAALAADGFVTVVSLPLRSQDSCDQIAEQLEGLVRPDPPVLLFLSRVGELRVEPADGGNTVLTREVKRVAGLGGAQLVDLGPSGQFLVAQRPVPARTLQMRLRASIEARLMDPKWGDWKGEVSVAAAVRIDDAGLAGRRYTHLPMAEEATSPAHAHLNAPFYANISRTDAKEDVPFNEMLMDELCRCRIDTARSLTTRRERWAPTAATDLLTWDPAHSERWLEAAKSVGVRPSAAKLLPSLGPSGSGWSTFTEVRRWNELSEGRPHLVTAESVAKVGATILRPELGSERLQRIAALGDAIGYDLDPTEEEIGVWVEAIATRLSAGSLLPPQWESFYDDLAELDLEFDALVGRQILMSDTGELRATGIPAQGRRGRVKVTFFLPADDEDVAQIDVPASLREDVAFMHRDIDWNLHDGRLRKRPGREYLERIELVREYRTTAVVAALRQILSGSRARAVHRDTTRLAFRLFNSVSTERHQDFRRLPLLVENAAGKLIEAERALFSPAWATASGQLLDELMVHAASSAPELAALRERMMADPAPDQFPPADWHAFLETVGVTDGLPLEPLTVSSRSVIGNTAKDRRRLGNLIGLGEEGSERWDRDGPTAFFRPETQYRFRENPVEVAGQRDHANLDERGKALFARLIIRRLGSASPTDLAVTLVKVNNSAHEPQTIPTPFHSFVALAPWLPTRLPGQGEEAIYGQPPATWHHEGHHDRPPAFARLLSPDVGRELRSPTALSRLRQLGLRIWDDPDDAPLLVTELAALVAAGVRSAHEPSIRNEYEHAWHQVISRKLDDPFTINEDAGLVVLRDGRLRVRAPDDEDGAVLVPCRRGPAIDRMELADVDVLPTAPADGPVVSDIVARHISTRVIRTDRLDLSITVAGNPLADDEAISLLDDARGWLPLFLLAAQRFTASEYRRRGDAATRQAFERLRSTRVLFCEEASIGIDIAEADIPIEPTHPVLVDDGPLIVATGHPEGLGTPWTWRTLVALSRPLAELLREPELARGLAFSFLQVRDALGADPDDVVDTPVDGSVLARALDIGVGEIEQIRSAVQEAVLATLERLYPLVRVAFGRDAATPYDPDDTAVSDRDQLLNALAGIADLASTWRRTPGEVLQLVENPMSWHELADHLGVDFADLNRTLIELGPPYRPELNVEGQQTLFDDFIEEHHELIAARLRESHLDTFQEKGDLTAYTAARAIPIEPDPGWIVTCWLQDEAIMRERITSWLVDQGADPDLDRAPELVPVRTVQRENSELVWKLARDGAPAVRAWCAKNAETVPEAWDSDQPGTALVADATAAGFLDFEPLSIVQLIGWFDHSDRWPPNMPQTIDAEMLGLTAEDVREDSRRRPPQDPPPTVTLGDRTIVAEPASYQDLIEHLDLTLSETFLKTPRRPTGLKAMESGSPQPRRTPGEGAGKMTPRDPEQLKAFVGLAGEVCALRWLQRQYRLDNDDCWVSEYRGVFRGDGSGDDSLGFDFRIRREGRPDLLFEVKASRGDSDEFELTQNEDAVARMHTAKGVYTILLVTNVLDDDRQITPLPNPYSTDGRGRYRPTGRGIKYRFWRS